MRETSLHLRSNVCHRGRHVAVTFKRADQGTARAVVFRKVLIAVAVGTSTDGTDVKEKKEDKFSQTRTAELLVIMKKNREGATHAQNGGATSTTPA